MIRDARTSGLSDAAQAPMIAKGGIRPPLEWAMACKMVWAGTPFSTR